jgi:aldehyde:ferredoxin oxidoreductase
MHGYGGTILRINLTDSSIGRHPTEEHLARAFLGGRGLNVKRLWDKLPAHTDGHSPANTLVFGVGPLVGTVQRHGDVPSDWDSGRLERWRLFRP